MAAATLSSGFVLCTSSFFAGSDSSVAFTSARPVKGKAKGVRCEQATQDLEGSVSLYNLLGLEQHVGLPDIKSAYRQMARLYHPDMCPASRKEECTQKFLQVQDAYEILSDPERRAEYDYHLMHPLSASALGMGFGGRAQRNKRSDTISEAWKLQWEAQLSRLRSKPATDQARAPESWGARMRRMADEN